MQANENIRFRWLRHDEVRLGMETIARLWKKEHVLARDSALFRWQYGHGRDAEHLGFLVAEAEEGVVACSGLMVLPYHMQGTPVFGGVGAITVVDPRYREQALGLSLMREADKDLAIIGSFGINQRIARLFRLQGRHVFSYPRYVCLTKKALYERYMASAGGDVNMARVAWEKCGHGTAVSMPSGYAVEELCEGNMEEWDRAWRNVFAPRLIGVARDAAYLRWRYLEHPRFTYLALVVRNPRGNVCGLTVCRTVPLPDDLCALRILDFLPEDDKAGQALAARLMEMVPDQCAYVEHAALGQQWRGLKLLGLDATGAAGISAYTSPPDLAHTDVLSEFMVTHKDYTSQSFAESPLCYMTLADGDQDRPN